MLYCPNCKQTYESGTQRFCTNDGIRLLPAPSASSNAKSGNQTSGVFTGIFNRVAASPATESKTAEKFSPLFAKDESGKPLQTSFRPPANSSIFKSEPELRREEEVKLPPPTVKIFKSEPEFELQLEDDAPPPAVAEIETPVQPIEEAAPPVQAKETVKPTVDEEIFAAPPTIEKTAPRAIKQREVPASQAALGDRKTNPTGRAALTWDNPEVLIGQTIKGRYRIVEQTGENESGFSYLAEDKIVEGKRVSIRILMDEEASAFFTDNARAEERVSLSHVVHPNVASVIDSGELPEGAPFIITEYVEGKSIKDMLAASGQFNILRAARVIRQASYALSEMHQNRIVHRGLTPENIILTLSENGAETVKITDFGVAGDEDSARENFAYKAPEQIEGKSASPASDLYSLAAIAYQMLTNRLPFNAVSAGALVKAQRAGLTLQASDLRLDATPALDAVLEKALAYNPSARYPKARDFGDAFFNQVTTAEQEQAAAEKIESRAVEESANAETGAVDLTAVAAAPADLNSPSEISAPKTAEQSVAAKKSTEDLLWERRSPEPPNTASTNWAMLAFLGAIIVAALGIVYYAVNRAPSQTQLIQTPQQQTIQTPAPQTITPEQTTEIANALQTPTPEEIESPPLPRTISPPTDTVYFENSKGSLKPDAAKNFLGFSLYFPKDWRQNDAKNNFLDVSKNAVTGTPIEQMLVSYYDSKGTFKADRETFPKLKEKTETQLKAFVPNYQTVSEGETTVNGGWRAYEIKFAGAGKTANGENIKLYGRRLYIPAARNGMKNGYVLTMLATSLSPDVKSVDDVGVKGDLAEILTTFEPNQNF